MFEYAECPVCKSQNPAIRLEIDIEGFEGECPCGWHDMMDVQDEVEINKGEYTRIVALEQAVNLHQGRLSGYMTVLETAKQFERYIKGVNRDEGGLRRGHSGETGQDQ